MNKSTQMIEKSNFDIEQYKIDLNSAYECGIASILPIIEDIEKDIMLIEDIEEINGKILVYQSDVLEIIDKHISKKTCDTCVIKDTDACTYGGYRVDDEPCERYLVNESAI